MNFEMATNQECLAGAGLQPFVPAHHFGSGALTSPPKMMRVFEPKRL